MCVCVCVCVYIGTSSLRCLLQPSSSSSPHMLPAPVGVTDDVKLLHYAQEQQRKKEEVAMTRRKMFEMEDTIRELQER